MNKAAWIVAWTINHGDNNLEDKWAIEKTEEEARAYYGFILINEENLHCAAYGQLGGASEPHWMDGEI